jgi:hypothetical protein
LQPLEHRRPIYARHAAVVCDRKCEVGSLRPSARIEGDRIGNTWSETLEALRFVVTLVGVWKQGATIAVMRADQPKD